MGGALGYISDLCISFRCGVVSSCSNSGSSLLGQWFFYFLPLPSARSFGSSPAFVLWSLWALTHASRPAVAQPIRGGDRLSTSAVVNDLIREERTGKPQAFHSESHYLSLLEGRGYFHTPAEWVDLRVAPVMLGFAVLG